MNEELKQSLIKSLNLENASAEAQEAMLSEVGGLIYQGALLRAMEKMEDSEAGELEEMLNQNKSPDEIFNFLKEKVSDFEEILKEEAQNFISGANNIMSQIGK